MWGEARNYRRFLCWTRTLDYHFGALRRIAALSRTRPLEYWQITLPGAERLGDHRGRSWEVGSLCGREARRLRRLMDEILHHPTWVTCRKWEESEMRRDESEMRMWWERDQSEKQMLLRWIKWELGWHAREIEMRLTCEWDANDLRVQFLSNFCEHPKDCKEWTPTQVRQNFELVRNRSNCIGFWKELVQIAICSRRFRIWHSRPNLRDVA
jgi:hypothetical protein